MDEHKQDEYQEDDLERYGVWVKAGPEEVVDADDDFDFADLPADGESADGESDDLDLPDIGELDMDDLNLDGGGEDAFTIPQMDAKDDHDDLISLDDLDIEEADEDVDPFSALDDSDEYADGDSEFDIGDLTDSLDTDSLDDETAVQSFDSTIPGSDEELSDITLEDFDTDDDDEDGVEELLELEEPTVTSDTPDAPDAPDAEFLEDEFLEDEFRHDGPDLQNLDESDIPHPMDTQEREAFQLIQHELADIKRELADLRQALRSGAASHPLVDQQPFEEPSEEPFVAEEDISDEAHSSGFFEEDEDETIALTGDELDNILNTAEFTEQAGEAEELDDDYLVEAPVGEEPDEEDDFETLSLDDYSEDFSEVEPLSEVDETPLPTQEALSALEDEFSPLDDEITVGEFESTEDDPAVRELADMDIDEELSDIESLKDDSDEPDELDELDELDEIEIDLDSLDAELNELDATPITEEEEDDFASFVDKVETDIQEIELDDDFDDETDEYPVEEADEDDDRDAEEIELEIDDLDVDDLDLGDLDMDDLEVDEADLDDAPEIAEIEHPEADVPKVKEPEAAAQKSSISDLPEDLKQEIRSVLSYMDHLLEALPDDKIEEFAKSEHFDVYKRLFEELGLET